MIGRQVLISIAAVFGAACQSGAGGDAPADAGAATTRPDDATAADAQIPEPQSPEDASTSAPATILGTLRWTSGTGTSAQAWTDGDPSRSVWCDPSTIAPVVYAANDPAAAWPGPGNVVSFRNTSGGCGGIQLTQVFPVPETGAYWCWRYYYKQDAEQVYFHHHGLGDLNPVGSIDLVFHQVSNLDGGAFGHGLGMNPSDFGWWAHTEPGGTTQRVFSAATWYRFEMILHWLQVSEAPTTWRYRVFPRVHDLAGNLLADARHYRADYVDGERVDQFLDAFYGGGGFATRNSSQDTTFESIRNYYHGIAQSKATSTGRTFYAAVDVGLCAGPTAFIGSAF
jgi:hypothetical protein